MTMRVLLVDDHAVFVETLAVSLGARDDVEVVAVTTNAADASERAAALRPDLALVDISLPDTDGIELCRQLRRLSPATRVIMLTGSTDPSLFPRAMDAGACGYLLKEAGLSEVVDALERAHAGQVVVPQSVMGRLLQAQAPKKGMGADLTKRELEVLALLGEGSDVRAVAKTLGITWHTARSYVKSVLTKLGARSQLEAVSKAIKIGILSPGRDA